jgi:outer membrane protein, heavy metal efflux system
VSQYRAMRIASRRPGVYRITRGSLTLIACLGVVLIIRVADAQERLNRITMEDAVSTATRQNTSLRAKQAELQAVRANEITAGLRPNPTASYSAEQLGNGSVEPQHTVIIAQPIETGGKRQRRLDSARAATRTTGHELDDVRRLVVAQVKNAFSAVLVAQATLALAEQNLVTLDEIERLQRVRAEKGDISQLELLRLQVQRFAFERDAGDARLAIEAAKIALRAAIGPDAVADSFDVVGELDFRDVPLDRDQLRQRALANRPDLQAAQAALDKARADVNLARANAWWDVTPQIEYQRIGPDNTIGFGFSFPLRIFDRNQGEIARTRAEAERSDALTRSAAIQALAEVDTALSAVTIQRARVIALRDTYLPKAQQARTTVEFAYRRGGASLLDFLDAQRTYRETALEHLRAIGNFWTALYQLEAAVGGSWND